MKVSNEPNPFDKGIVIHDGPAGGYNWSLSQHREYYTLNVLGTGGLSHEQYCKEFPKAAAALAEADDKFRRYNAVMGDPANAALLHEVIKHILDGKPVALAEAFPNVGPRAPQGAPAPPAPQPMAPPPPPQQAQVDPDAATDMHTHGCQMDEQGNGQTDAGADGHVHAIRANQILAQNGHTHDMNQMQQAQQQPQQQQPMQPMMQPAGGG